MPLGSEACLPLQLRLPLGGSFFMTFLDLAMSAGIGVRKWSINETTLLSLSSSSCSDSDSSELYSIRSSTTTATARRHHCYMNMTELAKHVASWTSGFNPIIPEIMLVLKAIG